MNEIRAIHITHIRVIGTCAIGPPHRTTKADSAPQDNAKTAKIRVAALYRATAIPTQLCSFLRRWINIDQWLLDLIHTAESNVHLVYTSK